MNASAPACLRVVLVEPRFAGNIGSVARVCANFGIREFHGVASRDRNWFWDEARKIAVPPADRILDSFVVHSTVGSAIEDSELAIGFTRRPGDERAPTIELPDIVRLAVAARARRVSLVFGNEETGLTDDELMACTHFCTIPTADAMPSMNLSHAVAVVAARVFDDFSRQTETCAASLGRASPPTLATIAELHGLFSHARELLVAAGMTSAGNPDRILRRLERLAHRAKINPRETKMLRGIVSRILLRVAQANSKSRN